MRTEKKLHETRHFKKTVAKISFFCEFLWTPQKVWLGKLYLKVCNMIILSSYLHQSMEHEFQNNEKTSLR